MLRLLIAAILLFLAVLTARTLAVAAPAGAQSVACGEWHHGQPGRGPDKICVELGSAWTMTPTPTATPTLTYTATLTPTYTATPTLTADGTLPGEPILDATYESIGIRAPFAGDLNANNTASFRWRPKGSGDWYPGMAMTADRRAQIGGSDEKPIPNPYRNEWRASVLLVQPGREYEVEITLADPEGVAGGPIVRTVATRSNAWPSNGAVHRVPDGGSIQSVVDQAQPGDTVIVPPGVYRELVRIRQQGQPGVYLTLQGEPGAVIDATDNPDRCGGGGVANVNCGVLITGSYVRVTGLTIVGSRVGVKAQDGASYGVLDNLKIHGLRFAGGPSMPILIGASESSPGGPGWTISDNDLTAAPGDPAGHAIDFRWSPGGHVIRRNTITFSHRGSWGVHGSDCIGGIPNQGPLGLGGNNDIHHNHCDGATDDGIEVDGSGMNSRYWGNTITRSNGGFSAAPVDVGPAYIFRNWVYDLDNHWTNTCYGLKTGEGGTGVLYLVHNTFALSDPAGQCVGADGIRRSHGLQSAGGGTDAPLFAYNNVFHGSNRSISHGERAAPLPVLDHNLHFRELAGGGLLQYGASSFNRWETFQAQTGQERNGRWERPQYVDAANGDYRLLNDLAPLLLTGINEGAVTVGAY